MSSAILLVGSPKPRGSASRSIGEALLTRLEARGWKTSSQRIPTHDSTGTKIDALLAEAAAADLVVLSFPLYIDTVPSEVMHFLELWEERAGQLLSGARLVAITQCGFPEATQTETALAVCRSFARHAGVEWAGGLGFGMGGSLAAQPLDKSPLRRLAPLLDETAEALTAGKPVPNEIVAGFAKKSMPRMMYIAMGHLGWRMMARGNQCKESLRLRRYAQAR